MYCSPQIHVLKCAFSKCRTSKSVMIGVIKPFRKALSYHLVITSFEKAFLRLSERCLFIKCDITPIGKTL